MSVFKLNNLRELSSEEQLALEGGTSMSCGTCPKCSCSCTELASASHDRQAKEATSAVKAQLNR